MGLSNEQIQALLSQTPQPAPTSADTLYKHNFDKAALFLLDLGFANLFEPWNADPDYSNWFRCKGCGAMVKRLGRESHHSWHKRDLTAAA